MVSNTVALSIQQAIPLAQQKERPPQQLEAAIREAIETCVVKDDLRATFASWYKEPKELVPPPAVSQSAEEPEIIYPDTVPNFPQELKNLNRWIVRVPTKQPYSAWADDEDLGPIDPHDKQYQAEFNVAMGALAETTKFSGAGFVFNYTDGYTGIDFDHCVNPETGEIESRIWEIIQRMNSYTEFSPSRTGVHVIVKGWQFPLGEPDNKGERKQGGKVGTAEMYSGKRYFTVSGNHVPQTPLTVNSSNLDWLHERIFKNREFVVARERAASNPNSIVETSCVITIKNPALISSKYDTLTKGTILRSKDTTGSSDFAIEDESQIIEYPSQSEADCALLSLIRNKLDTDDTDVIKAEFRSSPLGQRKKAERDDYLDSTLGLILKSPRQIFVKAVIDDSGDQSGVSVDRPKLLTEVGNARRLIEVYGKNIRYCPEDDAWLHWNGKVWLLDRRAVHIHDLMKRVLIQIQSEANNSEQLIPELMSKLNKDFSVKRVSIPLTDTELAEAQKANSKAKFKKVDIQLTEDETAALERFKTAHGYLEWAKQSESSQKIRGSIEQARSEPGVAIAKVALDTKIAVCNVENGAFRFDIKTGETTFGKHLREDLATKMMPVKYDPSADCPQFRKFITWMFPDADVRAFVQTFLGLCLTGIVVRRVLILYGEGANGKSTLMKVLYHLFGEATSSDGSSAGSPYARPVAFSTFAVGREDQAGGARADLMPLKGARLISASESNKSTGKNQVKLDMARLKELTGGDFTVARGLYQADETRFVNQGKIIIQTNNVPNVPDDSDGAWDRIKKVDCNSRIDEAEQDEQLAEKLIGEASGVLNWLLEGLARYFGEGLVTPEAVDDSTLQYRGQENHMGRFCADECDIVNAETTRVSATDLYARYKMWCAANGETPEPQKGLTQYFQRKLKIKDLVHTKRGNFMPRITLKPRASGVDAVIDG